MKKIVYLFIVIVFLNACEVNYANGKPESPQGYDLGNPQKMIMPESLLEISGITFLNGKADTLYAIQDEQGKVFKMAVGQKKTTHTKFGKSGDYEDVAILNGYVFVLKSNGTFFAFPFSEMAKPEPVGVLEWKEILPHGEYEGLYANPADGKLYVLCKNCEVDSKTGFVTGYILQLVNNSLLIAGNFKINVNDIRKKTHEKIDEFKPSAFAKNPRTNEWYIVASIDKLLVVTDAKWGVQKVYSLASSKYNQPEGIAFDANNNLYISNEGDDISNGNVLKIPFTKK